MLVWDQYGDGPHGAWIVGLAGAARMAPYVLLSWAVGSLGDHVRRDRLVRATMALRLVFLSPRPAAVAGDHVGLGVVAAALAVTARYADLPGDRGRAARGWPAPNRARATELLVTIEVSAWVVGPALGGLLLAAVAAAVDPGGRRRRWPRSGWSSPPGSRIPGPVEKAPDAVAGMLREVLHCRPALGALGAGRAAQPGRHRHRRGAAAR